MATGRPQFSVVARLLLLLSVGLSALVAFSLIHFIEVEQQERALLNVYVEDFDEQVDRVMALHRESLETFNYDYSWWDEMVDFVAEPSDEAWLVMAEGVPEIFHVDLVWVYNLQGELVYSVDLTQEDSHGGESPLSPEVVPTLVAEDEFPVFFLRYHGEIIEVAAAPIHTSDDLERTGEVFGYLISARYWTEGHLEAMGQSLASKIEMLDASPNGDIPGESMETFPEIGEVTVDNQGVDHNGRPVLAYSVHHIIPGLNQQADALDWYSGLVFVTVIFFSGVFIFCLIAWVILPLRRISNALESAEPEAELRSPPVGKEWERLTALISQSIDQRKTLREEVAQRKETEDALVASEAALRDHMKEREALARDLHDGIIQSVYAAGLLVETAKLEMDRNPEESNSLLEEARKQLNQLISDVRSFIAGLVPKRLSNTTLAENIEFLALPLRRAGIEVSIHVDKALQEGVSEEQRIHLVMILKELMSNATRHSDAKKIRVEIYLENGALMIKVHDHGPGFNNLPEDSNGSGLKNIQERADILGASFTYCRSEEGGGCACLTLPQPELSL